MMRRGWAVVAVEQVAELTEKDKHREQIGVVSENGK